MSNKSIDEIASDLTIAILEHNSKLIKGNNISSASPLNAKVVAQNFSYLRKVITGDINPNAAKKD